VSDDHSQSREISIAIRELSSLSPPMHSCMYVCIDTMREGRERESEREEECVNENESMTLCSNS